MSGKFLRMKRIFKEDGKAVIVALDHGQFQGPIEGIRDINKIIKDVVAGKPDAIIVNPGVLENCYGMIAGKTSVILRITGASTNYSSSFDYHRVIRSVESAVSLGADAVMVMGFIGGGGENPSLEIISKISESCACFGIPLFAEMLPQPIDHFTDPEYIALGARAAFELGADCLKVYYTSKETFSSITECVPIPVVIAGGPKGTDLFETANDAIEAGAAGVAFGRNVFQADSPLVYVENLVKTVHVEK